MCNVPEFIQLLKERKFPIEDMRMEVIEKRDGEDIYMGVITIVDEHHFTVEWNLWRCFLSCIANLRFQKLLHIMPYCFGLNRDPIDVECEHARRIQVIRTIK